MGPGLNTTFERNRMPDPKDRRSKPPLIEERLHKCSRYRAAQVLACRHDFVSALIDIFRYLERREDRRDCEPC